MDTASIGRHLRGSRLFARLPSDVVDLAAANGTSRALAVGETLWHEGQPAASFPIIVSGFFEIVRSAPGGGRAVLGVFGPRESIGISAVLERARYPASAVALSEATVLLVRAEPVLSLLGERPEVTAAMNRALLEHTDVLRWKVDVMSAGTVSRRLAALFLHFAARFGDEDADGRVRIPVALNRQQLAELVGARTETVIRALSRWNKAGWLETTRDGFVLASEDRLHRELGSG